MKNVGMLKEKLAFLQLKHLNLLKVLYLINCIICYIIRDRDFSENLLYNITNFLSTQVPQNSFLIVCKQCSEDKSYLY